MKLRKLKSSGHSAAASFLSTTGHIGGTYASTFVHQLAASKGLNELEIDVMNAATEPQLNNELLRAALIELKQKFITMMSRDELPPSVVSSYKLKLKFPKGLPGTVNILCTPEIVDMNGKLHECATVKESYSIGTVQI